MASTYTYTGEYPVMFTYYRDVTDPENPKTLVAQPGETYAIEQATGHTVAAEHGTVTDVELPMPPDDHWKAADKPAPAKKNEKKGDD